MNPVRYRVFKFRGFFRIASLLILSLQASIGVAQSTGSLSGKVIDAKSKEPVPFATVFLANTMIGVTAKEDGSYNLQNIPAGKYDLTVSSVGYKLTTIPVYFAGTVNKLDVQLLEDNKLLNEVVIKSKRSDYLSQLRIFKKYFLGETINAGKCTITNIDEIDFNYDEESKVLTAAATQPIEIENRALGYKVFYLLKEFKVDFVNNFSELAGIPRFELLTPKDESQERHWTKERDRAYDGSLNHFMRSLQSRTLRENSFTIYWHEKLSKERQKLNMDRGMPFDTASYFFRTNEARLFARKPDSVVQLKIVYKSEPEEFGFPGKGSNSTDQTSFLKFKRSSLVIHENGYYENPLDFYLEGYLAWSEKIAELMPWEYEPAPKYIK